ncbi:MAG: DUF4382 domain-containing protein [Gammaproteobacteria bacterium]|nr:DUF4382 domain-containing protein [Gammaproteobacteria bacterium]
MRIHNYMAYAFFTLLSTFILTACGGGGGSSSGGSGTGQVSFAITDSPVSNAKNVVVSFNAMELQSANSGKVNFTFDEVQTIDLLQLQGNEFQSLLSEKTVPAGPYQWVRLAVLAEKGNDQDSYIIFNDDSRFSLYVPSGDQSGLKINTPFNVEQDGSTFYTIDFDLKKSVNDPQGIPDYRLRPTLRLVKNELVGSISGTIDPALVMAENCANSGGEDDAVYVYSGLDIVPDDIDAIDPEPVSTANVKLDPVDGMYKYTAGFLEQGDYTVAFTCQASNDNPEVDDAIEFVMPMNAAVVAGETTPVNFVVVQQVSI